MNSTVTRFKTVNTPTLEQDYFPIFYLIDFFNRGYIYFKK